MRPAAIAVLLVLTACGSDKAASTSDAAAPDAAARAGDAGSAAAPRTCQEIRNCANRCGRDKACATRCHDAAPAAARATYDKVIACSTNECPTGDESCRCTAECFVPGACTDQVDDCDQGFSDDFCQVTCH
jgi:hypothetical protein